MPVVNMHEAKSQLSRLVDQVEKGAEVVIARAGRPVARLIRYEPAHAPRRFGAYAGQVRVADDFDELRDEIRAAFEGEGRL